MINQPINVFAIGSCRVKGMRAHFPSSLNFHFLENHLHTPFEPVQWLKIASCPREEFIAPDFAPILALTDEVHLRNNCESSSTWARYQSSLARLACSDVLILEISSIKNYLSNDVSYKGSAVHVNILCNNALRDSSSSYFVNDKPSILSRQDVIGIVGDFVGDTNHCPRYVILVPHFRFSVPGKGFLREREVLREAIFEVASQRCSQGLPTAVYDPYSFAQIAAIEDLFQDSSHYRKDKLPVVASEMLRIIYELVGIS